MSYLYLTLLIVFMDQGVKWLVQTKMFPYQNISIISHFFGLTYVRNYGAAFGILNSQTWLLIGLTIAVFAVIWFHRRDLQNHTPIFQIGLAMALGGAVGNFFDRVRLGYVVDLFDFYVWPVFNVADMGIVVGVTFIALGMFQQEIGHGFNKFRAFKEDPEPNSQAISKEESE